MVRKEPENLDFSSLAATFETASTYVFAERLMRSGVRPPSAPPFSFKHLQPPALAAVLVNWQMLEHFFWNLASRPQLPFVNWSQQHDVTHRYWESECPAIARS
jgi:hypothetical protein